MGVKFPYLSIIGELPFPDPCIEASTGNFVVEHPISQRFRRRSIWIGILMLFVFTGIMYFSFPYITGLQSVSPSNSRKIGKLVLIFYGSIAFIPYFAWWITRNATSRTHTRRITISKNSGCSINGCRINDSQILRGDIVIVDGKRERPIKAIWIQRRKKSYIVAAKDYQEDLDTIETLIPLQVHPSEGIQRMNGVV